MWQQMQQQLLKMCLEMDLELLLIVKRFKFFCLNFFFSDAPPVDSDGKFLLPQDDPCKDLASKCTSQVLLI